MKPLLGVDSSVTGRDGTVESVGAVEGVTAGGFETATAGLGAARRRAIRVLLQPVGDSCKLSQRNRRTSVVKVSKVSRAGCGSARREDVDVDLLMRGMISPFIGCTVANLRFCFCVNATKVKTRIS